MKQLLATLSIPLLCLSTFGQTATFDGGSNEGFTGNAFFEATGGNPDGNAHHLVNAFFTSLRTGALGEPANPAFLGDFSSGGPVTFSFDVKVDSIASFIGEISRPIGIGLIDRDIQGPNGASGVFFTLANLSSMAQPDWTELSVTVDDPTQTDLPSGWIGFGDEDPNTFEPVLPPGATFASVLASVDEFHITGAIPGFFFNFANFDLRIDNISAGGDCAPGMAYCTSNPNSSGSEATMGQQGVPSIGGASYAVTAAGATPGQPGIFFFGDSQIQAPFGDGFRCVGGSTTRLSPPLAIDGMGNASRALDFNALPQITPGSQWNFQFWYRDPGGPGGTGFNLSDGLAVTFCD